MDPDEVKKYATSEVDFYSLLGVSSTSSDGEIAKAYRRTALKYHPDKNPNNPSAIEKFHLLQIANDVLSVPEVKLLYDNHRTAREARKRQNELFEGKRRQMKDDLERRERGEKRKRDDAEEEEDRLQMEIRRLAELGRKRRMQKEEALARERLEEQVKADEEAAQAEAAETAKSQSITTELDRSVKVRWERLGDEKSVDEERLSTMFADFGEVESVFLLKDKKKHIDGVRKMVGTGVVMFKSIVKAHTAVLDRDKLKSKNPWLLEVFWASGKEPDLERPPPPPKLQASQTRQAPQTKPSFGRKAFPGVGTMPDNPVSSFSPSLEEVTLMRLKNAEKKRMEEEIRKAEAAEQAQEAT